MTRTKVLAVGLALPLVLAACGGGDDDDTGSTDGGGESTADLVVIGDDPASFDKPGYTLGTGLVTIELVNEGSLAHTLVIEDATGAEIDGFKLSTTGGGDDDGKITLQPGDYVLFCDVAGHRSGGMEATLTVT